MTFNSQENLIYLTTTNDAIYSCTMKKNVFKNLKKFFKFIKISFIKISFKHKVKKLVLNIS